MFLNSTAAAASSKSLTVVVNWSAPGMFSLAKSTAFPRIVFCCVTRPLVQPSTLPETMSAGLTPSPAAPAKMSKSVYRFPSESKNTSLGKNAPPPSKLFIPVVLTGSIKGSNPPSPTKPPKSDTPTCALVKAAAYSWSAVSSGKPLTTLSF